METIAAADGVRYVDQPFSRGRRHESHRLSLPESQHGHFVCLDNDDLATFEGAMASILSGRVQVNAAWDFRQQTFHRKTNRIVLKTLAAKDLVPRLCHTFDLQVVYSIRHPIPAAFSSMRNGFGYTIQAYLNNESFRTERMTPEQHRLSNAVLSGQDDIAKYVLNWVLENLTMLQEQPNHKDWIVIPYESFVLDTESLTRRIASRLGLNGVERMIRQTALPSRSTKKLHSTFSKDTPARDRLRTWRAWVSEDQERRLMDLLVAFDLQLYRYGDDLPDITLHGGPEDR